ncbi:MAG: hypothetical protein PHN46_01605 [Eubacteriales bacterium]|nr:hypothetical protein [Eubacteriales bacterium]
MQSLVYLRLPRAGRIVKMPEKQRVVISVCGNVGWLGWFVAEDADQHHSFPRDEKKQSSGEHRHKGTKNQFSGAAVLFYRKNDF